MDKIESIISRFAEEVIPSKEGLVEALKSGKKMVFYHGIDPTGPHLHLGTSTNLILLRLLQDLGHQVILLVGNFTARIGDPSDKNSTRRPLTDEEIEENMKTYQEQVAKIVRFDGPNPALYKFNADWLDKLTIKEMFELASNFTLQQIIERDLFQKRLREGKPIALNEFLYPLMQGYDSVALKVDGEIGGNDQIFNMLAGRILSQRYLNKDKFVISTPLLINPKTGEKMMSKSLGTYIALDSPSQEMFGKVMSLPDEMTLVCFKLCTMLPNEEIEEKKKAIQSNEVSPMDIKKQLAFEIVKLYHSTEEAKKAQEEFERVFQKKEVPLSDILIYDIRLGEVNIVDLLVNSKLVKSKSEAKRLIEQGAVEVDGKPVTSYQLPITAKEGMIVKVGKRKFLKISVNQ